MNDRELRDALRSLPTAEPGPSFVDEVVARVRDEPARGPLVWPRRMAWAATFVVALGSGVWWAGEARDARARDVAQAAARQEAAQLESEIARIREELARPPVIYLGGTERVDVVLDLGTVQASNRTSRSGRVMPAAARTRRP